MKGATLYRDASYGALAVYESPEGIHTIDHGFDDDDFDAALAVLESHCAPGRALDDGSTLWADGRSVRIVALSALAEALGRRGYTDDPMGERAVLSVSVDEAARPDLPTGSKARVHTAVEQGIRRHLEVGLSALRQLGEYDPGLVEAFERGGASDAFGRPLPFVRARGFLRRPVDTPAAVEEALRAALAPVEGSVVRASVTEADGVYAIEVALAPPAEAIDAYLTEALPTFESNEPIRGVRIARFRLDGIPTQEAIDAIEARATSCTAATSLARPSPRTVVARVPSTVVEGDGASDNPFSLRVAWLCGQLEEWGPALEYVGGVDPILGEHALAAPEA